MQDLAKYLQHSQPDLAKIPRDSWFDNSTIETHLDCNRLAWYNYFHHFESKSAAMSAGTVWHAGLEELHRTNDISKANLFMAREYEKHKEILQAGASRHAFGVINEALHEYDKRFSNIPGIDYHIQEFKFAVWMSQNSFCAESDCVCAPEDPGKCFWLVGRIDGIVAYNNDLLLFETKTTSQLGGSYLTGLEMSRQATTYVYAISKILEKNSWPDKPVKGVLFNIAKLGAKLEFLRHTVLRHKKQLEEFESETFRVVSDIRTAWHSHEKPVKNTRSCNRYGECQFTDLCRVWSGREKLDPPDLLRNFTKSNWRPF